MFPVRWVVTNVCNSAAFKNTWNVGMNEWRLNDINSSDTEQDSFNWERWNTCK